VTTSCTHRSYLDTDDDFATGELCGAPATHLSCDPVDSPTCAEHKCRCAKAIGVTMTDRAAKDRDSLHMWRLLAVIMLESSVSNAAALDDSELRERLLHLFRHLNDNLTATQTRCTQQLLLLRALPRLWRLLGTAMPEPQHESTQDGPMLSWFSRANDATLSFYIDGRDLVMLALKDDKATEISEPSDEQIVEAGQRLRGIGT
jgi:hypothetical protein